MVMVQGHLAPWQTLHGGRARQWKAHILASRKQGEKEGTLELMKP